MASILGDDFATDPAAPNMCVMYCAPETEANEQSGAVVLRCTLPADYPHTAEARVELASLRECAHSFPHRRECTSATWAPSAAQAVDLGAALQRCTSGSEGEAVLWNCVEAVNEWLGTNTLVERASDEATDAALAAALAEAEVSEDELDLDEEDMDEEMVEALREVLPRGGPLARKLDKAEFLPSGGKEQKAVLLDIWKAMGPALRQQMVASDSDDDSEDSADSEEAPRPPAGKAAKGKPPPKQAPMPPPAQRACKRGHTLTAINSKPADYKKLDGNVGNCDLCDLDYKYTVGGYHCDTCRNWDVCVACGSSGPAATNAGGKSRKRGKKK